jgi:homoserine dehydrogenase
VADIVALGRARASGALGLAWTPPETPAYRLAPMERYRTRHYLRFVVEDRPGVLGRMATFLGEEGVSIATVQQHETEGDGAPVILLTHEAREGDVARALSRLGQEPFVRRPPVRLRVEE